MRPIISHGTEEREIYLESMVWDSAGLVRGSRNSSFGNIFSASRMRLHTGSVVGHDPKLLLSHEIMKREKQ